MRLSSNVSNNQSKFGNNLTYLNHMIQTESAYYTVHAKLTYHSKNSLETKAQMPDTSLFLYFLPKVCNSHNRQKWPPHLLGKYIDLQLTYTLETLIQYSHEELNHQVESTSSLLEKQSKRAASVFNVKPNQLIKTTCSVWPKCRFIAEVVSFSIISDEQYLKAHSRAKCFPKKWIIEL